MENKKFRQEKRELKKQGNRCRRRFLQRSLIENPEEAHWDEFEFKWNSSKPLNSPLNYSKKFENF